MPGNGTSDPDLRTARLYGRLWRDYLRPYRGQIVVAFLFLIAEGSTLSVLSWLLKPLFDRVFGNRDASSLIWVGLAILGLFVLRAATSVISKYLLTRVAQYSTMAMQTDLLRHILTLDQDFFQINPPGALIERVQGDTLAVQGIWSAMITGFSRDSIALAGLFLVALTIDPVWTVAALIGAPLLIVPTLVLQKYIRRKTAAMREQSSQRATHLDEVFHGITAVKLNGMETYQTGRFARIVAAISRAEQRMQLGRTMIPALIDVVTGLGFFFVLMLAGPAIIAGERTVGDFMAFFSAMALTFQPMRKLGELAGFLQVGAASLERLFRLFDTQAAPRPAATAVIDARPGVAPELRLDNVQFGYGAQPVLRGASFTAESGRLTALVGPSGAGKSTVFALLTGLVLPDGGRVLLDGTDISTLPVAALRDQFAVVTQDAGLFDETIRENLTLGRAVAEPDLRRALDAAQASEFVDALPSGIDTAVGPRGSALSGGQRQRVAIARALVRNAPILLLDEATSALDAASEARVTDALTRIAAGRTTLVIAHRLATVRAADCIVVMDQGQVIDTGTHDTLLARGGVYAELCRLQFAK